MRVIIDGYNLLWTRSHGSQAPATDFDAGRESLIRRLGAYAQRKGHLVIVVFDAWRQPGGFEQCERRAGVDLIFTRQGERADQVIQRLARQYGRDCAVVSSDREIIHTAEDHGALVISSQEFQDKLHGAEAGLRGAGRGREASGQDDDHVDDVFPPRRSGKKGNPRKASKSVRARNRRLKGF